MKTLLILLLSTLCTLLSADAATYYVAPAGDDGAAGSEGDPWQTIGHAATNAAAGDVVRVQTGNYAESVYPQASGTSGAQITYIADGLVWVRQFVLNTNSYVRILGFHITNALPTVASSAGIFLKQCDHILLQDNVITNTAQMGILCRFGPSTYITIRSNRISYTGLANESSTQGSEAMQLIGWNHLVEYNLMDHVSDYLVWGVSNSIARNNVMGPTSTNDFPLFTTLPEYHHIDSISMSCSEAADVSTRAVIENNLSISNMVSNSHFFLIRDYFHVGQSNLIFRGNISKANSSFSVLGDQSNSEKTDYVYFAHNVAAHSHGELSSYSGLQWSGGSSFSDVRNNIWHTFCLFDGYTYYKGAGSSNIVTDYNLCYLSGNPSPAETHGIVDTDPLFTSYANNDFSLQSGSPAKDAGTGLTTTTASGMATATIPVEDSRWFHDGRGLTQGDAVRIGTNLFAIVTAVADGELTVDRVLTFASGDAVNLAAYGTTPDMGAIPYSTASQTFTVTATKTASGVTATVSNTNAVRFVEFATNGIPIATDHTVPFTATVELSGSETVTARAYGLFAGSMASEATATSSTRNIGTIRVQNARTR